MDRADHSGLTRREVLKYGTVAGLGFTVLPGLSGRVR